ncbi:MAG: hypothetical protein MUF51_11815, partial [Vicinamibacteria bacterium]|nr:hypothetical protein [Vicinamibacteria bacterium]
EPYPSSLEYLIESNIFRCLDDRALGNIFKWLDRAQRVFFSIVSIPVTLLCNSDRLVRAAAGRSA